MKIAENAYFERAGALLFLALMAALPLAGGGVGNTAAAVVMASAVLIFSLTALSAVRAGGIRALSSPIDMPLALLCVLALVAYPGTPYGFAGRLYLAMAASYAFVFYALHRHYRDKKAMISGLRALGGISAFYAVSGMAFKGAEIFGREALSVKGYYISFTYGSHSHYASFLVMGFWICAGLAFHSRSGGERLAFGAGTAVIFAAALASLSRGAIIGLAAGSAFFVIAGLGISGGKRKVLGLFGLLALGILFAALLGLGPILNRLSTLSDPASAGAARLSIWKESARLIIEKPAFGFGPGMFPYVFPAYQTRELAHWFVNHAHNDYIELAADMGVPALASALWALGMFFYASVSGLRKNAEFGIIGLSALSGCFSMAIHCLLDFNFFIPSNALMFAALAAASLRAGGARSVAATSDASPHRAGTALVGIVSAFFLATSIGFGLGSRHLENGESAMKSGGFMDAESHIKKAVSLNPGNTEPLRALGDLYMELGLRASGPQVKKLDFEKAAKSYAKATELCPVCGDYYSKTASALMRLERYEEALDALNSAGNQLPFDPYVKRDIAESLIALGRKAEAVSELAGAVGLSTKLALPSARLLSESGISMSEAVSLAPGNADELRLIAEASSGAGLDPSASEALGEIFRLAPGPEAALAHMKALAREGDINRAVPAGTKYAETFPENKDIRMSAAEALLRAGHNADAARLLKGLLAETPDDPATRLRLARSLSADGKHAEAVGALKNGIGLGGSKDDARLYYGIAFELTKTGDYAGALEPAKRAVSASPEDPSYKYLLGEAYQRLGLGMEAERQWEECLKSAPSHTPCARALKKPAPE